MKKKAARKTDRQLDSILRRTPRTIDLRNMLVRANAHRSSEEIQSSMKSLAQLVAINMAQKDRALNAIAAADSEVEQCDATDRQLQSQIAALSSIIDSRLGR